MEDQVSRPPIQLGDPARRRVRVKRKLTTWEKLQRMVEMPGVRRRERNQRLALVGILVALVVYLVAIRPVVQWMTPISKSKQTNVPIPSKAPGLGRNR